MEKEEAIKILNGYMGGKIDPESTELYQAIELAVDILEPKPSLPSNLDEAAEEYAYNNWEDNDYHTGASEGLPFDAIGHTEKCFKAGAEWMAGQGYTVDGAVICDKELTRGYKDIAMSIPDELKVDDKVTLQIRRRQ